MASNALTGRLHQQQQLRQQQLQQQQQQLQQQQLQQQQLELENQETASFFVRALYDFESNDASSLSFRKGAVIEVLTQLDSGWWDGLLDNDIRGWFPSNYVEPISDQEAELELSARAHLQPQFSFQEAHSALATSTFSGLGFGPGFDSLEALIKSDSLGTSDAFGQLAEAAMLDPHRRLFRHGMENTLHFDDRDSSATATAPSGLSFHNNRRNSRMSESSSYATTSASPNFGSASQSDVSSIPPRSHSNSLTEADAIKSSVLSISRSNSPLFYPAAPVEKDRSRALSMSNPTSSSSSSSSKSPGLRSSVLLAAQGRPRAATNAQASASDDAARSLSYSQKLASSTTNPKDPIRSQDPRQRSESDFWVPRATERGEIVYYNTRTGAISTEIPPSTPSLSQHSANANASANFQFQPPDDNAPSLPSMHRHFSYGPSSSYDSRVGQTSDSMATVADSSRRISVATSGSRPSSANSNSTAVLLSSSSSTLKPPARNAIQHMPDPVSIPYPWKVRLTDDEKYFFFYNKQTREDGWELPASLLSNLGNELVSDKNNNNNNNNNKFETNGKSSAAMTSNVSSESDESDIDGAVNPRMPGKSPSKRGVQLSISSSNNNNNNNRHGPLDTISLVEYPSLAPFKPAPLSLLQDETAAVELQKSLSPSHITPVSFLIRKATETLRQLVTIVGESISTDGLTEGDRGVPILTPEGVYLPRMANSTVSVVSSVRQVLYSVGSLCLSDRDLALATQLIGRQTQPNLSDIDGVASDTSPSASTFNQVLQALCSGQSDLNGLKVLHAAGVCTPDKLGSTPMAIHQIARRVNAVLSKLVLSSRQVIDNTITLVSSSTTKTEVAMNDHDAQVFEKLFHSRQRLKDDALELNRSLQSLAAEAERERGSAISNQNSRGWLRRVQACIESDTGLNGVGVNTFGGGMAAGWRGNGFILPSKVEAACIKMESQGGLGNISDIKRDIQALLIRGKSVLRRRPTQLFTARIVPRLEQQLKAFEASIGDLTNSITGSHEQLQASLLHSKAKQVLTQQGWLISMLEEIDIASSLDLDGSDPKMAAGSAINQRNALNAEKARGLVKRFTLLKQASYDVSCHFLVRMQEALAFPLVTNQHDAIGNVLRVSTSFHRINTALISTVSALVKIAEEQLKDASNNLGVRSFIYGIDETSNLLSPTSSTFSRRSMAVNNGGQHEELSLSRLGLGDDSVNDADVMYLGPGIAVPNGPRLRNKSSASSSTQPSITMSSITTSSSPQASLSPAGRGSYGISSNRQRSTSVTTGGSSKSAPSYTESQKYLLKRRGTLAEPHVVVNNDEADAQGGVKIRRILGEDAPLASTLTHDSESSSQTTPSRRKEDEIPWYLEPDYSSDDIVIGTDGQVKGATLGALLARLTMHDSFDASFNNTFLMTYRSFTTTEELLELLIQRYRVEPPNGMTEEELTIWIEKKQKLIRLRVFNVLKSWLETHFYQGEDDKYLDKVKKFALDEMAESPSMKAPSQHLLRLVERRQGDGEQIIRKMVLPTSAPPPILPKNIKKLKLLEIDPLELARQLTLIESKLYNKVRPVECLGLKWTKPSNNIYAKGIMESINTHNHISAWVAEAILQQDDLKKRAALIKHFIAIAHRCRSLNNFSGMWAIVSALSTAPVHRLRRTWDAINQKHVLVFESLESLMSASRNWANYRETIHKLNPPCVPFLGRYLGDLTFIEDGNRDRLKADERLINFGKRQKTAEVIREITIHQSTPYNLTPVAAIQKYIDENLVESRSPDDLYEQSLLLEPREREDEKIARLLQESGFL